MTKADIAEYIQISTDLTNKESAELKEWKYDLQAARLYVE